MSARYTAPRDCPECGQEWRTSAASKADSLIRKDMPCPTCRRARSKIRQTQPINVLNPPGNWVQQARCAGNPDLWHSPDPMERDLARAICRACPVILQCRLYAVNNGITDGIWGGMDGAGRRRWKERTA